MRAIATLAVAVVLLAFSSSAAEAQPAAGAQHDWTGWYVGVNAGHAWGSEPVTLSGDRTAKFVASLGVLPTRAADDPEGFLGGVQAGVNHQMGRIVLGVEADLQAADIGASETLNSAVPGGFFEFSTRLSQRIEMLGTVRMRLGVAPIDRLLLYGTAGFAFGSASVSSKITNPGCVGVCASGKDSAVHGGWTGGAGAEYAFTRRWSMKAEYLFYDLGGTTVTTADQRFGGFQDYGVDLTGHIVRLGVNFGF